MMVEVETTRFLLYFSGEFASYRVKNQLYLLCFLQNTVYMTINFPDFISFFHTILKLSQWKAVTSMKMSTFFKKSFWPTFLIVHQTIILLHLKDGLDRQYLTTDSIHLVIGYFIFANIFVAIFSNSKMWDKSWDKKSDSSKKKYILKK